MENLKVTMTTKATPEMVWKGVTDPKLVKQYFFGTDLVTTWKKGEPIYFRGEWEGKKYEDRGTVLSVDPGKHVSYTYWSSMGGQPDKPENYRKISYDIEKVGTNTQLTVTQESEPEKVEHSKKNWTMVLDGLKKILEK